MRSTVVFYKSVKLSRMADSSAADAPAEGLAGDPPPAPDAERNVSASTADTTNDASPPPPAPPQEPPKPVGSLGADAECEESPEVPENAAVPAVWSRLGLVPYEVSVSRKFGQSLGLDVLFLEESVAVKEVLAGAPPALKKVREGLVKFCHVCVV
jgi:hypothetical protein